MTWELWIYGAAGAAAVAIAFLLGRRTSVDTQRARELEVVIEDVRKDHECALSELEAAKHELKRNQRELAHYRENVLDHFTGTAELMRDLSTRYRAVCEHLGQGAELLCPERSPALETSFSQASLGPETPRSAAASPPPVTPDERA